MNVFKTLLMTTAVAATMLAAPAMAQERIALDNTYAERHGLGFDLRLILKTVPALFQSENV